MPQSRQEGGGAPVAVRHPAQTALRRAGAPVEPCHFGVEAGFIEEDEFGDGPAWLPALPLLAGSGDVGPVLLCGAQGFFIAQAELLRSVPQGGDAQAHLEFSRDALLEFGQRQLRLLLDPAAQRFVVFSRRERR
jgi:hypothetical protein